VLTHDNAVDVDATQAELRDGVLRVTLPKAAAAKARKIAVS
jgi:HSP20 family molecular chaperone IbpA